MGTATNPVGRYAIMAALAISIVMIIYYFTGGDGKVAFGFAVISLAVAAFIYIFYARLNTVQRTGYMSLLFVIMTALLLPFFFLAQPKVNADSAVDQYNSRLNIAAGKFTTYCSSCHGLLGQGIAGPQLNNGLAKHENGNKVLDKLTADDIRRIITGGIPDTTNPAVYLMPQWGQTYGGPFNDDDINGLVALIMSSDGTLRGKANALNATNGFNLVPQYLTTADLQQKYKDQLAALANPTGPSIDLTALTSVTITVVDTPASASAPYQFYYTDPKTKQSYTVIKIKAGTTVTWDNLSSAPHSVTSGTSAGPSPDSFKSDDLLNKAATYQVAFGKAGKYPYYCTFHPGMVGEIDVV